MPRTSADYRALHAEAARFEPRLSRAFRRSSVRMRSIVSVNALAAALNARDVKAAMAVLTQAEVKDALAPCATIVRDAVLRGGRIGMDRLAKRLGR